jgi:hypothetical protein
MREADLTSRPVTLSRVGIGVGSVHIQSLQPALVVRDVISKLLRTSSAVPSPMNAPQRAVSLLSTVRTSCSGVLLHHTGHRHRMTALQRQPAPVPWALAIKTLEHGCQHRSSSWCLWHAARYGQAGVA